MGERSIYQEAEEKRQWIYYAADKTWYTPAEFVEHINNKGGFPDYTALSVADPCEALNRASKSIYSILQRRDEFQKRILAFYSKL